MSSAGQKEHPEAGTHQPVGGGLGLALTGLADAEEAVELVLAVGVVEARS